MTANSEKRRQRTAQVVADVLDPKNFDSRPAWCGAAAAECGDSAAPLGASLVRSMRARSLAVFQLSRLVVSRPSPGNGHSHRQEH